MRSGLIIWFTLGGMLAGYFLVHPFAMVAYLLSPQHPTGPMELSFWGRQIQLTFSPDMLVMSLAFIFMGGVSGFCLGGWYLHRAKLAKANLESQRRLAALETLKALTVTLAHYIRNANVVIGGFSSHLQKHIVDPEFVRQLRLIHRASHDINMVINSLESLTQLDHTRYIDSWETEMIDLKQELEARLQALPKEEAHES